MNSTTQLAKRTPSGPTIVMQSSPTKGISHESVSKLAYQKWLGRGCPIGDSLRDWIEAEAELKSAASGRKR